MGRKRKVRRKEEDKGGEKRGGEGVYVEKVKEREKVETEEEVIVEEEVVAYKR